MLSPAARNASALTQSLYTSSQGFDCRSVESSSAVERLPDSSALIASAREFPLAPLIGTNRKAVIEIRRSLFPVIIVIEILARVVPESSLPDHSHSIVLGGLELISYTTLLTPSTLLIISFAISCRKSYGSLAQSAVIPSVLVTALRAAAFW